jgi:hypothetical protein
MTGQKDEFINDKVGQTGVGSGVGESVGTGAGMSVGT